MIEKEIKVNKIVTMQNIIEFQLLLARNLKMHRTRIGITQMELAERCNVSTSFIGEIEICRKFPSAKTLQKLIDALGIEAADLFRDTDPVLAEPTKRYMEQRALTILLQLRQQINKQLDIAIESLERYGL